MEAVYQEIAKDTIKFGPGDEEKWRELFEPLYAPPPANVSVIRDERYGPAERNLLDVFVPKDKSPNKPVLLYIHGGGFTSGDKLWSEKVYSNIGWFFASQGIVTVIANHQLVPHVTYPGGAEDIQLMRDWMFKHIAEERYGNGSSDKVVLFGHSSGGAHIAMNVHAAGDAERTARQPLEPPIAGILYLDCPFWMDTRKPGRQKSLGAYFGSFEDDIWYPKGPLGLFERLPEDSLVFDSQRLPTFLGTVEWEIPETSEATVRFFEAYRKRSRPEGSLPLMHVFKRHNHLSVVLSIGTEDRSVSEPLLDFIRHCVGEWREIKGLGIAISRGGKQRETRL